MVYWRSYARGGGEIFSVGSGEEEEKRGRNEFGSVEFVRVRSGMGER